LEFTAVFGDLLLNKSVVISLVRKRKMTFFSRCRKLWRRVNHEVLLAFSTILYLVDMITDIKLGVTYLRDSRIWHGVLTLLFVIISHIVFSMTCIKIDKNLSKLSTLCYNLKRFLIPPPLHMFLEWKK